MLYNKKLLLVCFVGKKQRRAGGRAEVVALVWMGKRSQKCMFPVKNLIY